jgi:hypothetical protein
MQVMIWCSSRKMNLPFFSKQENQDLSQAGLHRIAHGQVGEGYLDEFRYQASNLLECSKC